MSNQNYNGWENKETWALNLRYEEIFANMAQEQEHDDVVHMADCFESLVNELEFEGLQKNSLAHEAVGTYLDRVDWTEIAEHYFEPKQQDEEDDDDEDDIKGLSELLAQAERE